MVNRKQNKRSATEKTFLEKLGDQASHVKEELVAGKDHLMEIAGDAIDSVKTSIKEFKDRKTKVKKTAKKAVGKRIKKAVPARPASKKSPSAKKTVRKAAPRKAVPGKAARKKSVPARKVVGKSKKK